MLALEVLLGAFCLHLVQGEFWSKFRVFQETKLCVVSCVSLLDAIWVRAGPRGFSINRLCRFGGEECRLLWCAGLFLSLVVLFSDLCKSDELLITVGNVIAPNLPLCLNNRDDPQVFVFYSNKQFCLQDQLSFFCAELAFSGDKAEYGVVKFLVFAAVFVDVCEVRSS